MKITFLCFDLSDNSLGRAALLAQAASRYYDVELVGPMRRKSVWFPLRNLSIPVKPYPWKRYPAFISVVKQMVNDIDADLVFACKLRPTSFGVGWLKKKKSGIPLLVDIDDWEAGFFYHTGFWGKLGRFLNFSNPNGLPYTWLMERLVGFADEVTVSNRFLQERFSGTLVHHCRDTSILDPARFDKDSAKDKLGLSGKRVVMFLGTPRAHKGVEDLRGAFKRLNHPDLKLAIVGVDDKDSFRQGEWRELGGRLAVFGKIAFEELTEYLAAADIVAIPQRATSDTVGQMPAKLFDAMAMAKPTVSTFVSDIPEVLGDSGYLVQPGNVAQLTEVIDHILSHPEEAREKGIRARDRCKRFYDMTVLESSLQNLIDRTLNK